MEKGNFLLNQIDEFREKAKQLQELLFSKEHKVQELQEIVAEREGKAKELSDIIEERQDAADRMASGVGEQLGVIVDGMIEKIDVKLNELNATFAERLAENAVSSAEQSEAVRALINEQNAKLSETVGSLDGQFERIKNEICEKIHTEDVNCYRNMQALIEDSHQKLDLVRSEMDGLSSLKAMLKAVIVLVVLNCAGLAAVAAYLVGLI